MYMPRCFATLKRFLITLRRIPPRRSSCLWRETVDCDRSASRWWWRTEDVRIPQESALGRGSIKPSVSITLCRLSRPVCESFCVSCHHQSALTYTALEQGFEPRWQSAQPGLQNQIGLLGPLSLTGFQAAVRLLGHLASTARKHDWRGAVGTVQRGYPHARNERIP